MSKSMLKRLGTQGQARVERLLAWLHSANLCAACEPKRGYRRRLIEFTVIDECEDGCVYPMESLEVNMSDMVLIISAVTDLFKASKP